MVQIRRSIEIGDRTLQPRPDPESEEGLNAVTPLERSKNTEDHAGLSKVGHVGADKVSGTANRTRLCPARSPLTLHTLTLDPVANRGLRQSR